MAKHAEDSTSADKTRKSRGSASSMKVKRTKTSAEKPKKRVNFRQVAITVVVLFFAVLMVASVLLPSLAQVYSSNAQRRQMEEEYEAALAEAGSATGSSASDSYDFSTVSGIIEAYDTIITPAKEKLDADPDNLAHILRVANAYMECGNAAGQLVSATSSEEDTDLVLECFANAEEYFDRYLAIKETDAVKVDKALCEFFRGDLETAIADLQAVTTESPDYAPAWLRLGTAYETFAQAYASYGMSEYETNSLYELAIEAYAKARDTDPNNDYGVRLLATAYINQLQATLTQTEQSYNTEEETTEETNGLVELWNTLNSED